jgi:hypothetical protein
MKRKNILRLFIGLGVVATIYFTIDARNPNKAANTELERINKGGVVNDESIRILRRGNMLYRLGRQASSNEMVEISREKVNGREIVRYIPAPSSFPAEPTNADEVTRFSLLNKDLSHAGIRGVISEFRSLVQLDTDYLDDELIILLRESNLLHTITQAMAKNDERARSMEDVVRFRYEGDVDERQSLHSSMQDNLGFKMGKKHDSLTDVAMKELSHFKKLMKLELRGQSRITDAGVQKLANLDQLETLDLSHTGVTDKSMEVFAGLNQLKDLHLEGTNLTPASLKELRRLKSLRTVSLSKKLITDMALHDLIESNQLHKVTLIKEGGHHNLHSPPLQWGSTAEDTSILDLSETPITDAGLKELRGVKRLAFLNLSSTQVTDLGIRDLIDCPNLVRIDLRNTRVTQRAASEVSRAVPGRQILTDNK